MTTPDLAGSDAPDTTRRRLLSALVASLSSIATAAIAVPCARVALAPVWRESETSWARLAPLTDLGLEPRALSVAMDVVSGYRRERRSVLVWAAARGGEVTALSAVCTHMGCNVAWSSRESAFACPCHGGRYDDQGRVVRGPPPRPLQRLATKIDAGEVWVQLDASLT